MIALLCFFLTLLVSPFKSKSRLGAENAALRREVIILRRKVRGRVHLTNGDRFFFVQLYRWFPSVLNIITIIRPETLVRWHRAGFRRYWRWKSRSLGGRPQIEADLRALIRRMSATKDSASLCALLQRCANAPIVGQGRALLAPGSADRTRHIACAARGSSSPLLQNLVFGTHNRYLCARRRGRLARNRRGRVHIRHDQAIGHAGMRRYGELSRGAERSSPRQFFPDCTIAMCGYDFREGHVAKLAEPIASSNIKFMI